MKQVLWMACAALSIGSPLFAQQPRNPSIADKTPVAESPHIEPLMSAETEKSILSLCRHYVDVRSGRLFHLLALPCHPRGWRPHFLCERDGRIRNARFVDGMDRLLAGDTDLLSPAVG